MSLDFLEGIGEFMRGEGLRELEIRDGDRVLLLRMAAGEVEDRASGPGRVEGTDDAVLSPLAGVVRLFPSPGEPPFAAAGERKRAGEALFCVEAMKHLSEVPAPRDLEVLEVLVEEGQAVEAGTPVVRVRWEEEG